MFKICRLFSFSKISANFFLKNTGKKLKKLVWLLKNQQSFEIKKNYNLRDYIFDNYFLAFSLRKLHYRAKNWDFHLRTLRMLLMKRSEKWLRKNIQCVRVRVCVHVCFISMNLNSPYYFFFNANWWRKFVDSEKNSSYPTENLTASVVTKKVGCYRIRLRFTICTKNNKIWNSR